MKNFFAAAAALLFAAPLAWATPSSTFYAPATAACQAYKLPHITYDTYFSRGPYAGQEDSPGYPVDTGLTIGLLPSQRIQAEAGFDLLLPAESPLLLNGKLCTPESTFFEGSPSMSFGIFDWGFKTDVNDYDVLYLVLQKALPFGGFVSLGAYHGMNPSLLTSSAGEIIPNGLLAGFEAPDIPIGLPGLKKLVLIADLQTGKNVLGAWGVGADLYFTDLIAIQTGPVWFFDAPLQPGKRSFFWSVQLDVDIPL